MKNFIYRGQPLKMPKSKEELTKLLDEHINVAARRIEDHVLYLQGRPNRTYGSSFASAQASTPQVARPNLQELRVDISMTMQRLAESNAQIATCLANCLDALK